MKTFNISDFGGVGDGKTLNTRALQAAIDACGAAGGGKVVIPMGCFLSGTVRLTSGVCLTLEFGAVLKASGNMADLESLPLDRCDVGERIGFLYAIGEENIAIEGTGTIDFNDTAFFDDNELFLTPEQKASLSPEELAECTLAIPARRLTNPILFRNCKNVRLTDVHLVNSPCWTTDISFCQGVQIRGVTVRNRSVVPNCDCLGVSLSDDVIISDCDLSGADDGLVFCGNHRVTVTNCIISSRSSGVRIGYIETDTEDIVLSNLLFHDTNRAIILQGSFGSNVPGGTPRHAHVRNVIISNIVVRTHIYAGAWWGCGEPLTLIGNVENVLVSGVMADCENGMVFYAPEGECIRNVLLRDWTLTLHETPRRHLVSFIDARDRATLPKRPGNTPWYYAQNARVTMENVQVFRADNAADMDIEPVEINATVVRK